MRKIPNEELNRLSVDEFKQSDKTPLIVILDDIRSLNNIGSVFRTCDAFRVEKIYLCGITATPPHRDIQKTALGATETVDWEHRKDINELIEELKNSGNKVFAIEQAENSIMLDVFAPFKGCKMAVIFGNEVKGVSQEAVNMCDGVIEIPQFGTKHSLNIAVSAGIVIWDIFQKLKKMP
jgi:23S rRNA (guanosine2251-2'-O)-methyltransferase